MITLSSLDRQVESTANSIGSGPMITTVHVDLGGGAILIAGEQPNPDTLVTLTIRYPPLAYLTTDNRRPNGQEIDHAQPRRFARGLAKSGPLSASVRPENP